MDLLAIVLLGFVIGAVLGGLGGGGAILTVPVLVYIVGQSGQDATTSSLVIVGLTAGVGVLSYLEAKGVRWGLGLTFGLVGFPATFAGSYLNHRVDENILLLGFSGLMVIAAVAMFGTRSSSTAGDTTPDSRSSAEPADPHGHQGRLGSATPSARTSVLEARATRTVAATRLSPVNIVAVALGVGLLTGFFGVGGGFVVVPALVLVLRLPIQQAVGTSLMIVALNSATSLVSRAGTVNFDWAVIVPFTLAAMVATLAGKRVADRLPAAQLKRGFAILLILVAAYTAWQSIDGLRASTPEAATSTATAEASPAIDENQGSTEASIEPDVIISPANVEAALNGGAVALDVRTPQEFDSGHLDGATNIDLSDPDFLTLVGELPRDESYVVYCASGNRAGQAIQLMGDLGFNDLVNGGGFVDIIADTSLPHS